MLMLMDASSTHSNPAAIHNAELCGMMNNAAELRMAPIMKYGRRLPHFGLHVRSLQYPIIGCTNKPVKGAAIQRPGSSSGLAPNV